MTKLKIIMIGPEQSGKSVIANYLHDPTKESPRPYRPTQGARILELERDVTVDGGEKRVSIQLWDISGNLRHEHLWSLFQEDVDGVILVSNADRHGQKDEIEGWVNNFPVKMKLSPTQVLGLANHPSGRDFNAGENTSMFNIDFIDCSFETRGSTLGPLFEGLVQKLVRNSK